jgi:hypothetical protein
MKSGYGTKRTCATPAPLSAFGGEVDIEGIHVSATQQ